MRTGAQKVLIFQGLAALTEKEAPNAGANCKVSSGNAGAAEKLNDCETRYCPIENGLATGCKVVFFIVF